MNAATILLGALCLFFVAYRLYGKYISNVFDLEELDKSGVPTPAHAQADGVDYVATDKNVLIGHHYSSIAGAAPIVGPAVAVIWGWLPAILWIIVGVIFMGACHDFGALYLSMKHKGESMGRLASDVLGPRSRVIFLTVIFFLVWMVIAVFALVIANLFVNFPAAVIPVNFEIIIALIMGYVINKKQGGLKIPSLLAQAGLFVMIVVGTYYPVSFSGSNPVMTWIVLLMIYSFIASTLPVWVLLQPRDYINSHQLMLCLAMLVLGVFVTAPTLTAPAINPTPVGAPEWFPFLFITIACGAISGFHGLVSSGTTSKQVSKWKDAKAIGYGSMLGEGLLALLATLAVSAGFSSSVEWHNHYSSWGAANGLTAKIGAFVTGSGMFLSGLGIPVEIAQTIIVVLIISFAATSLDTAARIQRYIIAEIGETTGIKSLKNRYVGSTLAVGSAFALMLVKGGGKGGLILWPLFGATNQMLAGLSLLVISVYLIKLKKPTMSFLIPGFFVMMITSLGIVMNINVYYGQSNWFLLSLSIILFLCQMWIVVEGLLAIRQAKSDNKLIEIQT